MEQPERDLGDRHAPRVLLANAVCIPGYNPFEK